jgi:hypothetical protein
VSAYADFIEAKTHAANMHGFAPSALPSFLFDFQAALVEWALRKGRAGIFADCGLGKTPMYLAWADAVVRRENKPVLVLLPLAVGAQAQQEAETKFGIETIRSNDGKIPSRATIVLTNYERLHYFDPNDFVGVVCDESSILKSFDGARRLQITEFMKKRPYRLLTTATAAPNDYVELGTSSEALGELGYTDVLNRFFKNDLNSSSTTRGYLGAENKWRFKGYAEEPFWRWVSSWARALRKPSDLGFADDRFVLPPLEEIEHVVGVERAAEGMLIALPASGLKEQREETKRTLRERCEAMAAIFADSGNAGVAWCDLNAEGDLLARMLPDFIQVSGGDSDDAKEEAFLAFTSGQARGLITKAKIAAWGMNWQHCGETALFPSHSYEQYYQRVRRFWRFGRGGAVRAHIIATPGQRGVLANVQRKAAAASKMYDALVQHMHHALRIDREQIESVVEVPSWL